MTIPGRQPAPARALDEIREFLFNSFPDAAVAHSYHVDALLDPAVGSNAEFQRFSEVELNELHHQVAAMGCYYRLAQGDAQAANCLAANLAGFLDNRALALQLAQQLPPQVQQNPSARNMLRLVQQSQQALQRHLPAMRQIISASPAPNPGAMLVGFPQAVPYGR